MCVCVCVNMVCVGVACRGVACRGGACGGGFVSSQTASAAHLDGDYLDKPPYFALHQATQHTSNTSRHTRTQSIHFKQEVLKNTKLLLACKYILDYLL